MQTNLDLLIYPRNSIIFGKSYGDWSIEWWKWLLQIPSRYNPSIDLTGENANKFQSYRDVIFLCQSIESRIPFPSRSVSISHDKSVFMPVLNWLSVEGLDGNHNKELMDVAKKKIDVVKEMKFTLNDITLTKEIWDFRVASRPFKITFPSDNVLGIESGIKKCASDGYWLFIKPMGLNSRITTKGVCSTGETNIGVEYKLEVK